MTTFTLDTSGKLCPIPILKLRKIISEINVGNKVKMIATDNGSVKDVNMFCKSNNHTLEKSYQENNSWIFIIIKN